VPITFAIAIVKYHFFDIDFIINRSVVYLAVIASLIFLYIVLFTAISYSLKGLDDTIPAVISVSAAALVLQPARKRIQNFVDKKFFRVQYNYREALKKFLEEIDDCLDINSLAEKVVKRINELIPVEKIGFFELHPEDKIKLISQRNFEFLKNRAVTFKREELKTTLIKPVALKEYVEDGVDVEPADSGVFKKWGMALVFPFRSLQNEIFGFLVLGKKKSGFRFTTEDIDLLNAVKSKVATVMERNKYQKELVMEHLEKERLEELNKMKSFIVSRVSHDFRTPLQSIGNFTQLLIDNKNYERNTVEKFLKIIEGESNRLKLMAEKVLDFSKIEKGTFEYNIEEISLNELVNNVIESLRYQLSINKFTVEINLYNDDLKICADNIGIEAVLINLISNAIKYSAHRKFIKIFTGKKEDYVFVLIKDEGIGISKEDIDNIFNPFLRGHNMDSKKIRGAGLGLSIVKHIMDAHKGKIEVESEVGEGSSFTLLFPVS
jgi:signal transduction histidine kinase